MIHALAILYARLRMPTPAQTDGTLDELETTLGANVMNDLNWLESELRHDKKYLVGENLTCADIMVAFSVQFIFARQLGLKQRDRTPQDDWKLVREWLKRMENEKGFVTAVERTGYRL